MLKDGGQETYCNVSVCKALSNTCMGLLVGFVNPDWEEWMIEGPRFGAQYH